VFEKDMSIKKCFLYAFTMMTVFILSVYLTINVLLKSGETVICPDIRGKNMEEAKKIVEEKGLSVSVIKYERRNDVPYNHITVQKPQADISIRKGRVVYVIVSEGPELIKLPNIIGKSMEEAEKVLGEMNVSIEKVIQVPNDRKKGKVLVQIPKEGESVIKGKQGVTIFIGMSEAHYYVMPEVVSSNITEMIFEMEKKGIKHKLSYVDNIDLKGSSYLETTIPPKSIFRDADLIEIKVNTGG